MYILYMGNFMSEKIVNLSELLKNRSNEYVPDTFTIDDLISMSEMIENRLNELYSLGVEDKDCRDYCMDEQHKILTNIFISYFNIFFDEIDSFSNGNGSNRTLYNFAKDLYKITNEFSNIENKTEENKTLKFKPKNDK